VGAVSLESSALGGFVRTRLLHAAAVMYHANMRAGTHCTKTRAQVTGSTKKLYKQKGTGRARAGSRKSGTRKHGGSIHGPKPKRWGHDMPRKQRHEAVKAALLGKVRDGELHLVESLALPQAKTKVMVGLLRSLGLVKKGAKTSVLILTDGLDVSVYKAARNIPGVSVLPYLEANARDILIRKNVAFAKSAFEKLMAAAVKAPTLRSRKIKGTRKATSPVAKI